MTIEEQESKIW